MIESFDDDDSKKRNEISHVEDSSKYDLTVHLSSKDEDSSLQNVDDIKGDFEEEAIPLFVSKDEIPESLKDYTTEELEILDKKN